MIEGETMAEFCLDCFNKISDTNFKRWQVKLFHGSDLCEECGEYKRCIARINTFGKIAEIHQARKEYKQEFGKPYFPSKEKIKWLLHNK